MNLVVLSGNLTKDPVIKRVARKDTGEILVVGRYGFAIDRELSKQIKEENPDMQKADFVSVVVFGFVSSCLGAWSHPAKVSADRTQSINPKVLKIDFFMKISC